MKLRAKTKDCRLIVKVRTTKGELIDEQELDAFSRAYIRGFLKPRRLRNNVLEYTGPVGISLYERLKKPITKYDFLFTLEQIVVAVQKVESNGLALSRLQMDVRNIFINETTKEVQFLYVPGVPQTGSVKGLVESVIYSAIPAEEQDKEYVARLVYYLQSQKSFSVAAVEKFVSRENVEIVKMIRRLSAGQSGFMTNKHKDYYDHYSGKNNSDAEATGLLDENTTVIDRGSDQFEETATGLLDDNTTMLDWGNDQYGDTETGLLDENTTMIDWGNDQYGDTETGLLGENTTMIDWGDDRYAETETGLLSENTTLLMQSADEIEYRFPKLQRIRTGEQVSINKPVFRIGKEKSYVDYFVSDNSAVSRSHADIITRNEGYFVIDLNSQNHTYINGSMIPIQCEVEIHSNDSLRLANEEFLFLV